MKRGRWQNLAILAFATLGLIGLALGHRSAVERESAESQLRSTQGLQDRRAQELADLRAKLSNYGKSDARDVSYVLPLSVAELMNAASREGITIISVSIEGLKEGAATFVRDQSLPLDGATGLRKVVLNLNGNYSNFAGLREFLDTVSTMPVAISAMSIRNGRIILKLEVFGI